MIADLTPYAEYKESGLPWLGQVPGHWTVETLRRCLRPSGGIKIGPFGSQLKLAHMTASGFKVYGQVNVIAGDIGRGSKYVDEAKFNTLRECEVQPGDLLITMMGTSGRCMVVPKDAEAGLMDSHLLRLRLKTNGIDPVFTALTIDRAPYVKEQVAIAGKGSIMHGLNSGMVKNLVVAVPPPDEQAAIVQFLAWANGRLERAIRAKRKVIALLGEQKQAIIHRAVTRGLDPSVPLKPSGIPWLGDIPQHWEVRKLKHLTHFVNGLPFKPGDWKDTGVPIIRIQNLNGAEVFNYTTRTDLPEELLIHTGDLMFAWSGNRGTSFGSFEWTREFPGYLNQHIFKLVGFSLPKRWFYYVLRAVTRHVEEQAGGIIGLVHVTKPELGSVQVPVAPTAEAEAIAHHVDSATGSLNTAISRLEREIELLREYRTRLVADVVTGKLDVREAARNLPVEAKELEAAPEPNDVTEELEADAMEDA